MNPWRRRLARVAVMAMLVGMPFASACGTGEPDPVAVARAYTQAVRSRNVEALLPMLEQSVVQNLEAAAERASAQVGGRRSVEPIEMLQVVHVDPMFEVANAELVVNDGERARVRLESTDGRAHELVLVLQDGQWRVVIPVAADPEAEVADPLAGGV